MKVVFLALFFGIISSNLASAMSCHPLPDDVIREYPIIFKGKAVATTMLPSKDALSPSLVAKLSDKELSDKEAWVKVLLGSYAVTKFNVQEVYKGQIGKEVDVYHFHESTYKDGMAYVIFTGKDLNRDDGIEGRLETHICSPRIFLEEKDQGPRSGYARDLEQQLQDYALEKNSKMETVR